MAKGEVVDPVSSFTQHADNSAEVSIKNTTLAEARAGQKKNPFDAFASHVSNSSEAALGQIMFRPDGTPTTEAAEQVIESGSNGNSGYGSSNPQWNYINAGLAEAYGMDKATAYQEALANTAHQREVNDLKAAGLNPVLSAGAGSGAAVFTGSDAGSSGSGAGADGSSGKKVLGALPYIVGACAGLVSGKPMAATAAARMVEGTIKAITG